MHGNWSNVLFILSIQINSKQCLNVGGCICRRSHTDVHFKGFLRLTAEGFIYSDVSLEKLIAH